MVVERNYKGCGLACFVAVLGCMASTVSRATGNTMVSVEEQKQDVIHRSGMSLEDCATACAKETALPCRYFKYLKNIQTCLLSATDNPRLGKIESEVPPPPPSAANSNTRVAGWVNTLKDKMNELEEEEASIENMKTSIADMKDELKLLKRGRVADVNRARSEHERHEEAYTQLTNKIMSLKVDGEKFKAAVHALSNMQRVLAKEIGGLKDEQKDVLMKVSELDKSTNDLDSLTASLRGADATLQRELDTVREGINDLAGKLNKLRDRVSRQTSAEKLTPTVVKLKHNQGALATALETMADKVDSLMSRVPFMEKEVRTTNEKVSNQAMYEQELQGKLKVLYKNLIELKKAVHDLLDPRSAVNMERSKGVLKLKSDVSMLAEMDKGIKSELEDQKEDMARLVKDVARVQLIAQNLKDKLTLVLTASREFQADIEALKEGQKNGLSVVEVAQMQKQVLVALNRLKTRETILLKQLNKYRQSVSAIAKRVKSSSAQKSSTHKMVRQLQTRLKKFEQEIKALYARTKTMDARMKAPKAEASIQRLLNAQAKTSSRVEDLVNQMKVIQARVAMLGENLKKDEVIAQQKEEKLEEQEQRRKQKAKLKKQRKKKKKQMNQIRKMTKKKPVVVSVAKEGIPRAGGGSEGVGELDIQVSENKSPTGTKEAIKRPQKKKKWKKGKIKKGKGKKLKGKKGKKKGKKKWKKLKGKKGKKKGKKGKWKKKKGKGKKGKEKVAVTVERGQQVAPTTAKLLPSKGKGASLARKKGGKGKWKKGKKGKKGKWKKGKKRKKGKGKQKKGKGKKGKKWKKGKKGKKWKKGKNKKKG